MRSRSQLTLEVGRAAERGDLWQLATASDALDGVGPNGAMCRFHLAETSPEEAKRVLEGKGYRIDWRSGEENVSLSEPPEGVITYAYLLGPDTVVVTVANPDSHSAEKALGYVGRFC